MSSAPSAGRVLVVDDNPQNSKLARVILQGEGYEVNVAADANEALRMVDEAQPEVILMDVQIPGIDGLELTRMLKAHPTRKDIAVIAVTAYAMKGDRERALAAGCDDYLAKPLDITELPMVVAKHVAAHRRR